jgi:hypothetical protein
MTKLSLPEAVVISVGMFLWTWYRLNQEYSSSSSSSRRK